MQLDRSHIERCFGSDDPSKPDLEVTSGNPNWPGEFPIFSCANLTPGKRLHSHGKTPF